VKSSGRGGLAFGVGGEFDLCRDLKDRGVDCCGREKGDEMEGGEKRSQIRENAREGDEAERREMGLVSDG